MCVCLVKKNLIVDLLRFCQLSNKVADSKGTLFSCLFILLQSGAVFPSSLVFHDWSFWRVQARYCVGCPPSPGLPDASSGVDSGSAPWAGISQKPVLASYLVVAGDFDLFHSRWCSLWLLGQGVICQFSTTVTLFPFVINKDLVEMNLLELLKVSPKGFTSPGSDSILRWLFWMLPHF